MTRFDLLMRCNISLAAELIYGLGKDFDSPEELEKHLREIIPDEELQEIKQAALHEGRYLLSFSFKQ